MHLIIIVVLAAKLRVFMLAMTSKPEYVVKLIFASVVLHNYLREKCRASDALFIDWNEDNEVTVSVFQELPEAARGH